MFDCVIPAAGASSRMSAFKPLLPFAGSTLVETTVKAALDAGCRVLLVVGKRGGELVERFETEPYRERLGLGEIELVDNPSWDEGMLGSIQAALPLVRGDAFFIAHADMPFVAAGDYRALAAAWRSRAEQVLLETAILASHGGLEGHPVLIPSSWIPDILSLGRGDRIKSLLGERPRVLVETGPGALRDIDTPEDYAAALTDEERRVADARGAKAPRRR